MRKRGIEEAIRIQDFRFMPLRLRALARSNRTNLATRKGNELISSSGRQHWSEELLLKPLANLPYCHFKPPLGGWRTAF